jgi:hypothetical protein
MSPKYPLLYSIRGFHYNELLLDQGRLEEVDDRVQKIAQWRTPNDSRLEIALENLSLGHVLLLKAMKAGSLDVTQSLEFLQLAIHGLRQVEIEYLPYGLLIRAHLFRFTQDFGRADHDLAEVHRIARRSEMGLHMADFHCESARLRLAQHDVNKARKDMQIAEEMINRMGYHRRDKEVAELEAQLA